MTLTNQAMIEISDLTQKAETLARGNASDRALASVYQQTLKRIDKYGLSSNEMRGKYTTALLEDLSPKKVSEQRYDKAFDYYFAHGDSDHSTPEFRDLLAGSQSLSATAGPQGGYAIAFSQVENFNVGMSQTDDVLSPTVTDFVMEDSVILQPQTVTGYDLSQITATNISENTQQVGGAFPVASGGKILKGNRIWKASFEVSLEAEQDIRGEVSKVVRAMGVSFARALGSDAVTNLIPLLPSPSVTTASGLITGTNLLDTFFALNRFYRVQPLTSWLCSDWVYEKIRKAVDSQNRPLINIEGDSETLLGKPIHVSPTFSGGGSPAVSGSLVLADWSHWHLRCSKPSLQRAINAPNTVEFGKALMIGRVRFDSLWLDESAGAYPPASVCSVTP